MKNCHPDYDGSFKVYTRRAKKSYPITSMEVSYFGNMLKIAQTAFVITNFEGFTVRQGMEHFAMEQHATERRCGSDYFLLSGPLYINHRPVELSFLCQICATAKALVCAVFVLSCELHTCCFTTY